MLAKGYTEVVFLVRFYISFSSRNTYVVILDVLDESWVIELG